MAACTGKWIGRTGYKAKLSSPDKAKSDHSSDPQYLELMTEEPVSALEASAFSAGIVTMCIS